MSDKFANLSWHANLQNVSRHQPILNSMPTDWNKDETLAAANGAACLSELLACEKLYQKGALRWLEHQHIEKFLKAIDAEESKKLRDFAERWRSPSFSENSAGQTKGFPLLDWLWVIGPDVGWKREHLKIADEPGAGRKLVARLAEFDPDWVGRWWVWRCENGKGFKRSLDLLEDAVIKALSESDFRKYAPTFTYGIVATIIRRQPTFLELLLAKHRGSVLGLMLNDDSYWQYREIIKELSSRGIPSDAVALIDGVLDSEKESKPIELLNDLVKHWGSPSGSDPVTAAMVGGHKRLIALFRSQWCIPHLSSASRDKPDLWAAIRRWGQAEPAFARAARAVPISFRLELGFDLGLRIAGEEGEPSPQKVAEHLDKIGIGTSGGIVDVLLPMVELWAALRTLAKYQANSWSHKTELVGLRAKVASLAASKPDVWAQALSWILVRSSDLGDVALAVTLELALTSAEVSIALDNASNDNVEQVRLKARGLRTLLHGLEDPGAGLAGTLADAAARHMDGIPVFPHPLTPLSATWLGSTGVEQAITNGVRRASERFAAEVRDQGGDIEEALTKALVKEIEVEFRELQPRLKLFGSGSRSPAPVLSVRQRPLSKSLEEPVYGCDLALLLNATVHNRYSSTWVDLIQVKKSSALQHHRRKRLRIDSWKIESKQLGDILKWSATAAYWLIASAGEVFVIPAKHLLAVKQGRPRNASSQSFTVGYNEVRSAAIPLGQYLTDLLIGQWVGTTSDDVVRIAKGDDSNIRPRIVVEVTISVGQENQ